MQKVFKQQRKIWKMRVFSEQCPSRQQGEKHKGFGVQTPNKMVFECGLCGRCIWRER